MPYTLNLPGITLQKPETLPEDLKVYADGASAGLIIISFGSSSLQVPEEWLMKFMEA